MTVLGLVGSPRKGSNTDILMDTILEGARERGHEVTKVYLIDHEVGPCVDCRGCKKGDQRCIVDDGMQSLYSLIDGADTFIFGTPVYWWGPSGPMKMLIDRLRPYYGSGRLEGRRGAVVAPAAERAK